VQMKLNQEIFHDTCQENSDTMHLPSLITYQLTTAGMRVCFIEKKN
jgi:hypothetical protein